MALWANVSPFP